MHSSRLFGPRVCYLTNADGAQEIIEITVRSSDTYGRPTQGDAMSFTGQVRMASLQRDSTFTIYATDEILLIGRAVKIVGSQLLGECERGGMTLRTADRDDIRDPLQLF